MESDHRTDVRSNPHQAYLRYAPTTIRALIVESSHCAVTRHMRPYFSMINYRPQRSCGKVMFLHVSVILFTGGRGSLSGRPPWTETPRQRTPQTENPWIETPWQETPCTETPGKRLPDRDPPDRGTPGQRPPRQRPPRKRPSPDRDTPPPTVTTGWYASYCNTFLFVFFFPFTLSVNVNIEFVSGFASNFNIVPMVILTLMQKMGVEPIFSYLMFLTIASIIFKNTNATLMKSVNGPLTVYF